jgi:uncharacterized membrane protein
MPGFEVNWLSRHLSIPSSTPAPDPLQLSPTPSAVSTASTSIGSSLASSESANLNSIVLELLSEVKNLKQRIEELEVKSVKQATELERLLGCVDCVVE